MENMEINDIILLYIKFSLVLLRVKDMTTVSSSLSYFLIVDATLAFRNEVKTHYHMSSPKVIRHRDFPYLDNSAIQ